MDGRLEEVFRGVVGKRLTKVEVGINSNQHELNGVKAAERLLGPNRRQDAPCRYGYINDDGGEWHESTITYYDSRENKPRAAEYRLFYPSGCEVMELRAQAGDLCWLLLDADDKIHVLVAESGSGLASRLDQLFGTDALATSPQDERQPFLEGLVSDDSLFALDVDDLELLEFLGVPVETSRPDLVGPAIDLYGPIGSMPTSRELASFVRGRLGLDAHDDADGVFMAWNTVTDDVFFGLERHFLQGELDGHFANQTSIDIDLFYRVAKSRTNARFSRAGATFESHLAALLASHNLRFTAQSTEMADGSKPDFLLPGRDEYEDDELVETVTFLGAKTTARERWRQLVGEASRVTERFFATRDKKVSGHALATMNNNGVHPVMAKPLIDELYPTSGGLIMPFCEFLDEVADRQEKADMMIAQRA